MKKQKKSKEEKTEAPKKSKKKDEAKDKSTKEEAKGDAAQSAQDDNAMKDDMKADGDAVEESEKTTEDAASSTSKKERQPSLSLASRERSASFKRELDADADGELRSPGLKSPALPSPGEEGDAVQNIFKRQKERIHILEDENKRLQKERQEKYRLEEELEEMREKQGEASGLPKNAEKPDESNEEVQRLVSLDIELRGGIQHRANNDVSCRNQKSLHSNANSAPLSNHRNEGLPRHILTQRTTSPTNSAQSRLQ